MTDARRAIAIAVIAIAACSRGHRDDDPGAAPADPAIADPFDDVARQGCACATLGCIDDVQQQLVVLEGGGSRGPADDAAREHLDQCTAKLARALIARIHALTDDLCACRDRACYDALRPRVDATFDKKTNGAALGPRELADLQRETDRFTACDAKWSAR